MTVEVVERSNRTVRCECGALLKYNPEDVQTGQRTGVVAGWPGVACPEISCGRACLVAGFR